MPSTLGEVRDLAGQLASTLSEFSRRARALSDLPFECMTVKLDADRMGPNCGNGIFEVGDILLVDLAQRDIDSGLMLMMDRKGGFNVIVRPASELPRCRNSVFGAVIGVVRLPKPHDPERVDWSPGQVTIPAFSSWVLRDIDPRLGVPDAA